MGLLLLVGISIGGYSYLQWRAASRDALAGLEDLYRRGEWSKAAEAARAFLKSHPDDAGSLRLLARASARQGRDEGAEAIYRRLGTAGMGAEDLFLLGRGLIRRDQRASGLAALGAARDADPDHAETLLALLELDAPNRSLTQALADAERLRRQPAWDLRGLFQLARIRRELLQPALAADLLAEALEREPELVRIGIDLRTLRRELAACLMEAGRPAKAGEQLAKILASGPDEEASWLLSRVLMLAGHLDEARSVLAAAGGSGRHDPLQPEPAPYMGAARCQSCHAGEYRAQQQSRHAQSIRAGADLASLQWPVSPVVDRANSKVSHILQKEGDRVKAETRVEDRAFAAVVEYALGSNHQGRSFVGRDREGQPRELRISQYPSSPEWDRTSEHPEQPPGAEGYLGRPISEDSVRRCVHCHSTNFQAVFQPAGRPEAADHGIGCERCHGPAGHHTIAIETKFPELAIAQPRLASASAVVSLCAQCHQSPGSEFSDRPRDIRFQAPSLVRSRCYTESGTLSCVTCHDPHQNASRKAVDYEVVCMKCHPAGGTVSENPMADGATVKTWVACQLDPKGHCLECHMPRISDAVSRAGFTDHYIRIRAGEVAAGKKTPSEATR